MSLLGRYQGLSDPLRTERRVELVVLVLVVILLVQFLLGGHRAMFPSMPDSVKPMPDSLQVSEVSGLSIATPEQRAQIRQRPLFWASRAPLVPEPAQPEPKPKKSNAAKPGKIENVKLSGVFGAGDAGGIIVIAKGKKRRLMVGEELDGWTLKSIDPVSAEFTSGARLAKLELSIVEISRSQLSSAGPAAGANDGKSQVRPSTEGKDERSVKNKKDVSDKLRLGGGDRG